MQRTLPRLLETSAERFPDNVLLLEKRAERYEGTTYREARERVHRFGAGLMDLGLQKGDRVALLSEGRNDWVVAELGILCCGAVNVPISVKIDEASALKFRLLHSGCRMAVVSRGQVEKIRAVRNDLPDLQLTIVLDPLEPLEPDEVWAGDVAARGERLLAGSRAAFDARWQGIAEPDPANICYTSGTTADPKGIVLTHRNYTANIEQGVATIHPQPDWVLLNVLPWDHAFGHTCGIYMMMMSGAALASVQAGRSAMEAATSRRTVGGVSILRRPLWCRSKTIQCWRLPISASPSRRRRCRSRWVAAARTFSRADRTAGSRMPHTPESVGPSSSRSLSSSARDATATSSSSSARAMP